ncbi:MAG: fibrobacter succinogenes major paralogous domain-containing protein [Fibrobacter sp.]|nr:fibrobacter succinogenes major paralogous domain-containing protein [Fibrobacter sp.]
MKYTNSHVVIPGLTGNLLSIWKVLPLAAVVVLLAACGDDPKVGGTEEDAGIIAIENKTVSGVSQKGPFVNGSSVTIQALNGETLAQTGRSYQGKIKNDQGEFSVSIESLVSPYVVLKANGFYRNENTGEKTKAPVELFALSDISNRDEVNVNLLTHLEYERSLYLASVDSMTVAAAKKQAEKEVLTSFGIEGDFANSEDLSIFGKGDESAALLAISILMQGDLNEADFSERLADYAADIEVDGKWDDAKTATEIADWGAAKSLGQSLSYIRTKITDWGLSAEVPAFEKYVDNYWWQNYGLGTCEENREGEIKKNENSQSRNYKSYFICENGAWRVASDTEYDTYQQKCDEDGKIVFGNINKAYAYDCDAQRWRHASNVEAALGGCVEKRFSEVAETEGVYYICQKREWRTTTDIEKDTYGWKIGNDADVKYGDVVKTNCYVFEESVWRSGNDTDCSLGLQGCTALRQDTVGKGSDNVWYICDARSWRNATTYEKDTFGWADSTDGAIRKGNVTDSIYVFDKTAWRATNDVEAKLGGCVSAIADSVGKVGSTYYICKSNKWVDASAIEYDTYGWDAGKDGEVRAGQINKTIYYIYETSKNAWRNATTLEKDTYDHKNNKDWANGVDGEIKKGSVTDTIYVFDETTWRVADDIEKVLGGCAAAIQDSVGKVGDTYYICSPRKWIIATILQYDTYKHECSEFGQIVHGNVNTDYAYFCYGVEWKRFYGNENVSYGKLVDDRDGQIYRTVKIGDQTWMAENLNYADSSTTPILKGRSWCFDNNPENCAVTGRLYTWAAAIDSIALYDNANGLDCGLDKICTLPTNVQGICPSGWHLPTNTEWRLLIPATENAMTAGKILKSQTGWYNDGNGSDIYGFSALPGGSRSHNGSFCDDGYYAYFWSATQSTLGYYAYQTYLCHISSGGDLISNYGKNYSLSVRCIKDEEE